jgi:hypothetical protein
MLGGAMVSLSGSSTNVMMASGNNSTQASIKPKKSQSIEKKGTGHLTISSNAELVKKLPAKKGKNNLNSLKVVSGWISQEIEKLSDWQPK